MCRVPVEAKKSTNCNLGALSDRNALIFFENCVCTSVKKRGIICKDPLLCLIR